MIVKRGDCKIMNIIDKKLLPEDMEPALEDGELILVPVKEAGKVPVAKTVTTEKKN